MMIFKMIIVATYAATPILMWPRPAPNGATASPHAHHAAVFASSTVVSSQIEAARRASIVD